MYQFEVKPVKNKRCRHTLLSSDRNYNKSVTRYSKRSVRTQVANSEPVEKTDDKARVPLKQDLHLYTKTSNAIFGAEKPN